MKKFIYKNNYLDKVVFACIFSIIICIIKATFDFEILKIPTKEVRGYHSDILTINFIFSGFALTNLGILLSISDDQLVKKLEGTDILTKRNTVIAHSIIFGAISISTSLPYVLNFNFDWARSLFGKSIWFYSKYFFFNLEILSLCFSILYFILSIRQMIKLLSVVYVPRPKLSDNDIDELKQKINNRK